MIKSKQFNFLVVAFSLLFCGCSDFRRSLVNDSNGCIEVTSCRTYRDDMYHYYLTDSKTKDQIGDHGPGFSLITDKKLGLGDLIEFRVVESEDEPNDN